MSGRGMILVERAGKPPKWNPKPKPDEKEVELPHFVPIGCHKCWR